MLVVDRLLVSGIRFVLDKVAAAVETEMNDVDRLREELLAAQMRFELGEIDEAQLQTIEAELMPQIRAITERQRAEAGQTPSSPGDDYRVAGIEAEILGDPTERAEAVVEAPLAATAPAPTRKPVKKGRVARRRAPRARP